MKQRTASLTALLFVVTWIALSQSAFGQPAQVSSTFSLTYLNVQLSYPSEMLPGQSVSVSVQGTAKDSFRLVSLTVQVYYANGSNLRLLTAATVGKDTYMYRGDQVNSNVQATVPADAPRTSLVALVTETARSTVSDYYGYGYYYPYPYYYGYGNYSFINYYYPPYAAYPSYSQTDSAVAALTYIKAPTPEYVALQSEYQMLQQKLSQAQSDNQNLQKQLQAAQNTAAEKNAMISDLNQQLSSTQNTIRLVEAISVALVVVIVFVGAYAWRERTKTPQKSTSQEKAATS
jgi:hypothetical protein